MDGANDNKDYPHRMPQLFDEILLLCNGKTIGEIISALDEAKHVVINENTLKYSINQHIPQRLLTKRN